MTLAQLKEAVQQYHQHEENNQAALDGLEDVQSDIEMLIDCIRDDIRSEQL